MKKQYYKPEVEVLLVQGNKTLLGSPDYDGRDSGIDPWGD
jgi:hypothetical protein